MRLANLAIVVTTALLTGCGVGTDSTSSPPKTDLSTPDRALKSYWATQDWLEASGLGGKRSADLANAKYLAPLTTGTVGAATKNVGKPVAFVRDLVEVKSESESRASVLAKIRNATPIPPGADVTDYHRKAREGHTYKYVLEKVGAEWRVSEIWAYFEFMNPPQWQKLFDGTPHVESHTHP
jgi:hypothetical protein